MKRIIIGLTGPTGSGKSTAAEIAESFGVQVIDCDKTARYATQKGSDGLTALVQAFGDVIINADGTLNRKRLAEIAFSSKEKTELLNKTLLPIISELVKKEISADTVLLDAPTLFESGIDTLCDETVAVLSSADARKKRIIERDKLTIMEADTRMGAGKDDGYYLERAGHILYNDGDFEDYKNKAFSLFENLFGGR